MIVVATYFLYVPVLSKFWWKSNVSTVVVWHDVAELLLLASNSKSSPRVERQGGEIEMAG